MTITRAEALRVALECLAEESALCERQARLTDGVRNARAVEAVVLASVEYRLRERFAVPEFDRATASVGDVDPATGWRCESAYGDEPPDWLSPYGVWIWYDESGSVHGVSEMARTANLIDYEPCPTLDEAAARVLALEAE